MYNHQLDTFIKVADLGSFGKAAESLYISPTAVIQQINNLETTCGFKLFIRTNHGVKLTKAGESLMEDAKSIIKLSNEAILNGKRIAQTGESEIRIGTNLLYKLRKLPELWTLVDELSPGLKIQIVPIKEYENRSNFFSQLGKTFDLFEGIYASAWDGNCSFLELMKTPLCCAVSKHHPLAKYSSLKIKDLNGQHLVMPIKGVSTILDSFREEVKTLYPNTNFIDSTYYGLDTFTLCELNPYILISQEVYKDIHPDLVSIPLESNYSVPYGLIYSNNPNDATMRFIESTKQLME